MRSSLWSGPGSGNRYWDDGDWSRDSWYRNRPYSRDSSEWGSDQLPQILPDFVQGWYLFMDAGLDVMERNVLHAELKGSFRVREVETILRKHWSDVDLRKRDAEKGRFMANLSKEVDEEVICFGDLDAGTLSAEGFSSEEVQSLLADEAHAQQAMAAMFEARRTLKDARARQHAVRMGRQFYPSKPGDGGRKDGLWKQFSQPKVTIQCFRCGGPHKSADCKEKPRSEAPKSNVVTESAPLVFMSEEILSAESGFLSTSEVVAQGKAVIDGGATRTVGSTAALDKVVDLNQAKRGVSGVASVDFDDRPTFGFGNSSRNQCASTTDLEVPLGGHTGSLRIHALDQGAAPILLSIRPLRRLGAIIDFENDRAIFRHVDPSRMIHLERAAAGHQVMPLTEDVYHQSTQLSQPFPSLVAIE